MINPSCCKICYYFRDSLDVEQEGLSRGIVRLAYGIVALVSLLACLAAPAAHMWSEVSAPTYHTIFLIASAGWFVSAWMYDASQARPK